MVCSRGESLTHHINQMTKSTKIVIAVLAGIYIFTPQIQGFIADVSQEMKKQECLYNAQNYWESGGVSDEFLPVLSEMTCQ